MANSASLPDAVRQRREEIDQKHRLLASFLEDQQLDALLLRRVDMIAWFTAGADATAGASSEELASLALFITPEARSVLATNDYAARFFEEEIAQLGFQLKERRWYEGLDRLLTDICRSRKVATDWPTEGLLYRFDELRALRIELNRHEQRRLTALGIDLAHAVEATCRNTMVGDTECEVAGQLAHRMLRHGITPLRILVAADERSAEFRLAVPKGNRVQRRVTVAAVGRRFGLCAYACRTVCFGPPDEAFLQRFHAATMVEAAMIYQSSLNKTVGTVFQVAKRIYEKTGFPNEWVLARQGYGIGYSPDEYPLVPDEPRILGPNMAVAWSPSVGDARSGDTILLGKQSYRIVTPCRDWPVVAVQVAGNLIERPGVYIRPAD